LAAEGSLPAGARYHRLNNFLRLHFGGRVRKVSVDAGRGCPNRDGTRGRDGCVFCDPASFSPSRRGRRLPIAEQVRQAIERLRASRRAERFIAYFQPGTNTHGPVHQLRRDWDDAIGVDGVVGLAVGTRPDCLSDDVLELLVEFARRCWLSVELGLQSSHDASLIWMNRGHDWRAFADAVERCHRRGLRVVAHLILGLPGEDTPEVIATAERVAQLAIEGVKLHNLHVVRGTPLARMFAEGCVQPPTLPCYAGWVVDVLERLPWSCVVERLAGDAPPEYLLAPRWCLGRVAVRRAIDEEFRRRGTRQGAIHEKGGVNARAGRSPTSPDPPDRVW